MPEYRVEGRYAAETVEWLSSIANLVIENHIRARTAASDTLADGGPAHAASRLRAQWKVVEPRVELLSQRQRQVVELRFREGMRYADIADRLGIPVGTVRSRLARARIVIDDPALELANRVDVSPENPADAGPGDLVGVGPADLVGVGPGDLVGVGPADLVEVGPGDLVEVGPPSPVDASPGYSENEPSQ